MLVEVATCLLNWREVSNTVHLVRLCHFRGKVALSRPTHIQRRPIAEDQGRVVVRASFVHHLATDLVWITHQFLLHLEATSLRLSLGATIVLP